MMLMILMAAMAATPAPVLPEIGAPATAIPVTPALVEAGTELALRRTCSTRRVPRPDLCRADRASEVRGAVEQLLVACSTERWLPSADACLALVVTAAAEGNLRRRPACSAPDECVADCAAKAPGRRAHRCVIRCAARRGVTGPALVRILDCNDGGAATGPFQIHGGVRRSCERELGRAVDLEDLVDAGRCYASAVRSVAAADPCGEVDPWPTAFARVAGGTWRTIRRPDGTTRRAKRCGGNLYWRLAEAAAHGAPAQAADGADWPRAVRRGTVRGSWRP